jgi:hypothetical protein
MSLTDAGSWNIMGKLWLRCCHEMHAYRGSTTAPTYIWRETTGAIERKSQGERYSSEAVDAALICWTRHRENVRHTKTPSSQSKWSFVVSKSCLIVQKLHVQARRYHPSQRQRCSILGRDIAQFLPLHSIHNPVHIDGAAPLRCASSFSLSPWPSRNSPP